MNLSDFQIGQTVVMSRDRRYPDGQLGEVTKIGRKYVSVKVGAWERQFYKDDYNDRFVEKVDFGSPMELFASEESYRQSVDREKICQKLRFVFDWSNIRKLTYEQLKQIDAIVGNICETE